jgi:hypothetical protein
MGHAPSCPGTTIDLRAQVLEMLGPTAAVAKLANCVFDEPLLVLLVAKGKDTDLARCLTPGRWVHAIGGARFLFPQLVCALEMTSCEPITDEQWGGTEYVGYEEMLAPHAISTRARVMTPWRPYNVSTWDDHRSYGCTADVAIAEGRDGTRAVLHWDQGSGGCRFRGDPPAIAAGDLLNVSCRLDWHPHALSLALPPRTPILDLWQASDVEVVHP